MSVEEATVFAGPNGPCGGLLASLRDDQGRWVHPVLEDNAEGLTGKGMTAAVIDTGVVLDHPRLAGSVIDRVDFTGEGAGDHCGHGTVVALILLAQAPDSRLIDVKALRRNGRAEPALLVAALDWVAARGGVQTANLSAGVYRTWCTGDCDICLAATRLVASGVFVVAAAGNDPDVTACPAKARDVLAVAEVDPVVGALTSTSSPAGRDGIAFPTQRFRLELSELSPPNGGNG